jgi:Uma2 family endonuclease
MVEVLSPSMEAYDRGFKFAQYRMIESLQEYVLVSQTEPRVELFRRHAGGEWRFVESANIDAVCQFESIGCALALHDVFAKVEFPPPQPIK